MTEPKKTNKNKLSKQLEQEQNHRNGDHMVGYQQESGRGREGEKVQRRRSIISRHKIDNRRGEIKNGIGNRGLEELICATHGHELRGVILEGWGGRMEGG